MFVKFWSVRVVSSVSRKLLEVRRAYCRGLLSLSMSVREDEEEEEVVGAEKW